MSEAETWVADADLSGDAARRRSFWRAGGNGAEMAKTAGKTCEHKLTLRFSRGTGEHRGRCTCGWESGPRSSAGLVHGAHNNHLAELEKDNRPQRRQR